MKDTTYDGLYYFLILIPIFSHKCKSFYNSFTILMRRQFVSSFADYLHNCLEKW